jgi:hypothetical protein
MSPSMLYQELPLNKKIVLKMDCVKEELFFFDSIYGFVIIEQTIIQLSANALRYQHAQKNAFINMGLGRERSDNQPAMVPHSIQERICKSLLRI